MFFQVYSKAKTMYVTIIHAFIAFCAVSRFSELCLKFYEGLERVLLSAHNKLQQYFRYSAILCLLNYARFEFHNRQKTKKKIYRSVLQIMH